MQAYFKMAFVTANHTFEAVMAKKDVTNAKLLKLAREAKILQEQSKGNAIVKGEWPEWAIHLRPAKQPVCVISAQSEPLGMGL